MFRNIDPANQNCSDQKCDILIISMCLFSNFYLSGKHAEIVQKFQTIHIFEFFIKRLLKTHELLEISTLSQIFHQCSWKNFGIRYMLLRGSFLSEGKNAREQKTAIS